MTAIAATSGTLGSLTRRGCWAFALALACRVLSGVAYGADTDTLGLDEEAAFRAAMERAAPSVVRIESAGISEAALAGPAEASPAAGPSSGTVIDPEGWVVATEFAVPKDAPQAVVVLSDGTRHAARAVGRDQSRGLVLLKVDLPAGTSLPVAPTAPRSDLAVGQWTLAIGRTLSTSAPNVAIGILSAVNRAWGKAVQTDASVSPANYGGPLVDIEGRVIGILAPLPADTAGMMAGTELYDSGIGFAVPGDDISAVLPRLKAGETLRPGILGISYESRDPFTAAAKIASCSPGSPAAKAGLRAGDTVVAAAGKTVTRIAELRHELAPRYAGDTIDLVVERPAKEGGSERVEVRATLVDALPPWRRAILGIVAERTAAAAKEGSKGDPVRVRWLWPDGPAAKAGVRAGDVIESVALRRGEDGIEPEPLPVGSPEVLAGFLGGVEIGATVRLVVRRDAEVLPIDIATVAVAGAPPAAVPPLPGAAGARAKRLEAPEVAKPPLAVLPDGDTKQPLGVLVYFGPPPGAVDPQAGGRKGGTDAANAFAEPWKAAAARHGVAVILPAADDPQRWTRGDIAAVARAIDSLASRRPIDRSRVAFAGRGAGGAFAFIAAESLGPAARGVAILDSALPRQAAIERAEPGRSRWVLFGQSAAQPLPRIAADRQRLADNGFPVGMLAEMLGDAVPAEALCAWVECLGVL
jgi:serine protease Do